MKYLVWIIGTILFSVASCSGNGAEKEIAEESTKSDTGYCECNELIFDEAYNHFYRYNRRFGFSGNCKEYYPNGKVKLDKNLVEGKVHGKMISYYENAQIHEEQEFDMNFQIGERIIYTPKGEVKFHALYERGKQSEVLVSKPWLSEEPELEF